MEDKISIIVDEAKLAINSAQSQKELNDVKVVYLGKSGKISLLMRNLKDVPNDQKPAFGKMVNDARVEVEGVFEEKFKLLYKKELQDKLNSEKIDITIDKDEQKIGNLHPLTLVRRKVEDFFASM